MKKTSMEISELKVIQNIINKQLMWYDVYLRMYMHHIIVMYTLCHIAQLLLTRIILRRLSALSLDEGLNAPNGKTPSAAFWFRRPIKYQILARMRISDCLYFRLM
jgi:hypothetical protein